MSPRYGLSISALRLVIFAILSAAAPAAAQSYADARHQLDLSPDPLARSPRLLGMGHLSYTVDDPNNRITLWDFAGNPLGVIDDTVSTFALRPTTASTSSAHDRFVPGAILERQDLGARETRFGYEVWHRASARTTYGFIGDLGFLRLDEPYNLAFERRSNFTVPNVTAVVAGRLPAKLSERARYALRLIVGHESSSDRYRHIVTNAVGEFIDQNGQIGDPPDIFTPDEVTTRTVGGGVALGYDFGSWLHAGVGYDKVGLRIKGENSGFRNDSEVRETRPYDVGQASFVGRVGRTFEWGGDVRAYHASSRENWVFTLSSGPAAVPLSGRGRLLDRAQRGLSLRARARWVLGNFQLGAGFNHQYRRERITVPRPGDPIGFNTFLDQLYHMAVAPDTLTLPDSVRAALDQNRAWDAGGGVAWRIPGNRGTVGVEYHRSSEELEQTIAGIGPRRVMWEARAGAEYPVNPVLAVRAGYVHRRDDRDDLTPYNEYLSNGMTLGVGVRPAGVSWTVDTGYSIEWWAADFGDPGRPRGSRQQVAMQVQWKF